MTCPRCGRIQHFRCSDSGCVCNKPLPKGERYQVWQDNGEALMCPYCGFSELADFWEDRDITVALLAQTHSVRRVLFPVAAWLRRMAYRLDPNGEPVPEKVKVT